MFFGRKYRGGGGETVQSSLNICSEKRFGGGRSNAFGPSPPPYLPADPWIFHLKTT